MPSTPTTKSQVQAYKFVLRRMQSALVRRDAVMLHDPMRTHTRATIVGVCLGAVGLVGFLVWGLLSPAPKLPTGDGIVISKESGTVYVLLHNPQQQLVPTFNLASARLLLLAQQQQANGAAGQPPATQAATNVAEPTVVSDKDLKDVPKGRLMGIQDGPQLLPGPDQRPDNVWAVCDRYVLNHNLTDPARDNKVETTVLAGVTNLGRPLPDDEGLLVMADNKKTYLVYHLTGDQNTPNTDTVRAEVDLTDPGVIGALNLDPNQVKPRKITTALLNSIPEQIKLTAPTLASQGQKPAEPISDDFTVGSVFRVERAASNSGQDEYYVQEQDGIESIKKTTADLIRFSLGAGQKEIPVVQPTETTSVKHVEHINDSNIPAVVPKVLDPVGNPVACLGWSIPPGQPAGFTKVYVNNETAGVPIPNKGKSTDDKCVGSVKISTPNADGLRIDCFYMTPGRGAVVRSAASVEDFQKGPISLVSDRGVKFGVPDLNTAAALGLTPQVPAPDSIVRLLPDGASLNTGAVLQSYDAVPSVPGTYESPPAPGPSSTPSQPEEGGEDGTGQPGG